MGHANSPLEKKSDKTVTFVDEAGNTLEVVSNISKAALKLLRKQGWRKESEVHREQEDAALDKADKAAGAGDDDSVVEVGQDPVKTEPKKAAARSK